MKQDRFLTAILIFIAALVVLAVTLFLVRGTHITYAPEDSPEGVLQNYALALQDMDHARAYGYLAEGDAKPAYETFRQMFLTHQLDISQNSLQVGEAHLDAVSGEAWVDVYVMYAGSGLFDNGWSASDRGMLIQQDGAWKITYLPYPYWGWDWYMPTPDALKVP